MSQLLPVGGCRSLPLLELGNHRHDSSVAFPDGFGAVHSLINSRLLVCMESTYIAMGYVRCKPGTGFRIDRSSLFALACCATSAASVDSPIDVPRTSLPSLVLNLSIASRYSAGETQEEQRLIRPSSTHRRHAY